MTIKEMYSQVKDNDYQSMFNTIMDELITDLRSINIDDFENYEEKVMFKEIDNVKVVEIKIELLHTLMLDIVSKHTWNIDDLYKTGVLPNICRKANGEIFSITYRSTSDEYFENYNSWVGKTVIERYINRVVFYTLLDEE